MTQPYTDADVQALVRRVSDLLGRSGFREDYGVTAGVLDRDLKPFLPDPEDELVEEIAQAMYGFHWDKVPESTKRSYRHQAHRAFGVIKVKGLPS